MILCTHLLTKAYKEVPGSSNLSVAHKMIALHPCVEPLEELKNVHTLHLVVPKLFGQKCANLDRCQQPISNLDCEVDSRRPSSCQVPEKQRTIQNIEIIVISTWHSESCMPEPKSTINSSFQSNSSHSLFSLKRSSVWIWIILQFPATASSHPMNQEVLTVPLLHGD